MTFQLHVSGFDPDCDDEGIESKLSSLLSEDDGWCGPGTTNVRRGKLGDKPPYAFVLFYVEDCASAAAEVLNAEGSLRAEPVRGKQQPEAKACDKDLPDLRFRRKRLPSKKKHPDGLTNGSTQDANYKK